MNYIFASIVSLGWFGAQIAVAANLGNDSNVPVGWMIGSGVTIFFTGMWVSGKVTRFEAQQTRNIERMDQIERRIEHLEGHRR